MTTINANKPNTPHLDPIQYRVVFISPFFEVEVANGWQRWQTVRSQTALPTQGGKGSYPVLQFPSHGAAVAYAEETLGLQQRKLGLWRRILRRLTSPANPHAQISPDVVEVQVEAPVVQPLSVVHNANS